MSGKSAIRNPQSAIYSRREMLRQAGTGFGMVGLAGLLQEAARSAETEAANPRYTFGEIRVDGTGGHLTMDAAANIQVKNLGQPSWNHDYPHENRNFSGDCVYALQRHFVDCMLSGREFESTGRDYLKTLEVVFAAYDSASQGRVVNRSTHRPGNSA